MAYYRERYVPNGWTRTANETGLDSDKNSWPEVETIGNDIFDLTIDYETKFNDSAKDDYEDIILTFRLANNEIIFTQHKGFLIKEKGCDREYTYELKIIDHDTKSIMFYKPNLQRVEMAKRTVDNAIENGIEKQTKQMNEDIEVIVDLDEEDIPFRATLNKHKE